MKLNTSTILLIFLPTVVVADDIKFRSPMPTSHDEHRSILKETSLLDSETEPTPADREQGEAAKPTEEDPAIKRQVDAIQAQIDIEEQRLKSQMTRFQRQRERALTKNDSDELKKIEKLEQQAIGDYEDRLNQIIKAADSHAQEAPTQTKETRSVMRKEQRAEQNANAVHAKEAARVQQEKRKALAAHEAQKAKARKQEQTQNRKRSRFRLPLFGR